MADLAAFAAGTCKLPYAASATTLIILTSQFVGFYAVAMSEAPFLFAFLEYLQTERKFWLLASGVDLLPGNWSEFGEKFSVRFG